jgi:hypothetical protein
MARGRRQVDGRDRLRVGRAGGEVEAPRAQGRLRSSPSSRHAQAVPESDSGDDDARRARQAEWPPGKRDDRARSWNDGHSGPGVSVFAKPLRCNALASPAHRETPQGGRAVAVRGRGRAGPLYLVTSGHGEKPRYYGLDFPAVGKRSIKDGSTEGQRGHSAAAPRRAVRDLRLTSWAWLVPGTPDREERPSRRPPQPPAPTRRDVQRRMVRRARGPRGPGSAERMLSGTTWPRRRLCRKPADSPRDTRMGYTRLLGKGQIFKENPCRVTVGEDRRQDGLSRLSSNLARMLAPGGLRVGGAAFTSQRYQRSRWTAGDGSHGRTMSSWPRRATHDGTWSSTGETKTVKTVVDVAETCMASSTNLRQL